ncbi:MAG: FtsX-like permease family protein [Bryobacteraceae bacterium]
MIAYARLLRSFILRPLRRDTVRTLLTVLSLALGVGVVVAIDLAGDAAAGSFSSSLETLLGKVDLQITATGGVDERWMGELSGLPLNISLVPVVETLATVDGIGEVELFGLDLVSGVARENGTDLSGDPDDALVVSAALARRLGVDRGDRLRLTIGDTRREFPVVALVNAKDAEFLALDIAAAQKAVKRFGRIDRVDVLMTEGENLTAVEAAIGNLLPASYTVERPGTRREENQRMLRAFRTNLRVLSFISLVVGAFLIYNTIAVSVVRRRAEIGILRALGTGRQRILWLFLGEALLLGLAGSLLGVGLGRMLAEAAVALIAQTVNALYVSSRPAPIALDLYTALAGIFAGVGVALASAWAPAREATQVFPSEAMGRGAHESAARLAWKRKLLAAVLLALAAVAAAQAGPIGGRPLLGYASALLSVASAALAAPALVLAISRFTRTAARKLAGVEGLLAVRGWTASLPRTSINVAALATAIAMMASVAIMVSSFRETVLVWLDYQLRADLYVRPAGRSGTLAPEVIPQIASTRGVEAVDVFHATEFRFRGERATLGAGDLEIVRRYGRLLFLEGDRDHILSSLRGQDRAIISEPFANRHAIATGDRITLPLGARNVEVTVAGVYYEYSSERGFVILDRSTLLRYLPAQPPTNLAIYLNPEADATAVKREIQRKTAGKRIVVAENQALRRNAVRIFDRTFAITYALEGVAIVVAVLGAASSLLALAIDRRRELAVLRFLGASAEQIRRMVLLEAGLLGLAANLLGLALGFALSLLLIYVVNKQSFGWTIQFHAPPGLLLGALGAVCLATVLAGLYPARVASRMPAIEAVHED